MRLENRVAVLAGVGAGMGRATALLFAQEGARVAIAARNPEYNEETALRIGAAGGEAMVITGDASKRDDVDRIVGEVLDRYGRIDVLYSAAGGNFEPGRDFDDIDGLYWQYTLDNTANSLYNLAQAVHPVMRKQGGGAIVSVAASFSVRQEGNAAYGAAKGGLIGLSQSLARELYPDNIRVNCIAAGLFRASLGPGPISPGPRELARTGHHQDIAYAALYLASDEASWVTGQVLAVDGGVDVGARPLWEYET